MATGALNAQGVWIYGEDDSETTFSALLNKLGNSVSSDLKGRIVQIVSSSTSTEQSNATTTYATTGLSATITPTKSTNKILVLAFQNGCGKWGSAVTSGLRLQLRRGGTNLITATEIAFQNTTGYNLGFSVPLSVFDSPATTAATTYATFFASDSPAGDVRVNRSTTSTIYLIEVSS